VIGATGLDALVKRAGDMAGDLKDVATEVRGVVSDVRQITRRAADIFGTEEGERQVQAMLDNIEQITESIKDLVNENSKVVTTR